MLNDMGILADSVRYYHDADAFTATNLYHVPHAGSYHCDETYGMQRNYLDICQMLVVDEGELSVTYRGETRTAGPGSLILLDCREPHSYHALTPIRMRWFHFAGSGSTAYTHLILIRTGLSCLPEAMPRLRNVSAASWSRCTRTSPIRILFP